MIYCVNFTINIYRVRLPVRNNNKKKKCQTIIILRKTDILRKKLDRRITSPYFLQVR